MKMNWPVDNSLCLILLRRPRQEVGPEVHGLDVQRRHDDLLVRQGGLCLLRQLTQDG